MKLYRLELHVSTYAHYDLVMELMSDITQAQGIQAGWQDVNGIKISVNIERKSGILIR